MKEEMKVLCFNHCSKVQVEFADAKYAERGKKSLRRFNKGDMDAWMAEFADNAVYY
jgi:hypothetical protein